MSAVEKSRLIIVANAGRSGSTFLWNLLKANDAAPTILHEDIPVQISRPRQYNRAFDDYNRGRALEDPALAEYLHRWEKLLENGDIIETGWTIYHLLPVLHDRFRERLKVVVMHRDPWSVALSRANMGNYHPRTWYDDRHEVSPHDPRSIAPDYADLWSSMNHASKCLYWWYVIYREIDEFLGQQFDVPWIDISSRSLFDGDGAERLSDFIERPLSVTPGLDHNRVQRFMMETFPIRNEYLDFSRHHQINNYAKERFGYELDTISIEHQAQKYRLPKGIMPQVRNAVDYWSRRRRAGQVIRSIIKR